MPAAARWAVRGRTARPVRLPRSAGRGGGEEGGFLPSIPAVTPAPLPFPSVAVGQGRACRRAAVCLGTVPCPVLPVGVRGGRGAVRGCAAGWLAAAGAAK